MGQHYFAVFHLNKSKLLFLGIAAVVIVALLVLLAGSLINIGLGGSRENYVLLDFETVLQDGDYDSELHSLFPRYFVAGGVSYDNSILENHGIEVSSGYTINHFEDIGIYSLKSEVKEIRYYTGDNKIQILVEPVNEGYSLISFDKSTLNEGPIVYEFVNGQGERILAEEDYIYSVPLKFSVLEEGETYQSSSTLERFVIVDNEVKPVLQSEGYDLEILEQAGEGEVTLYVFGGVVETVQKQGENIRVYFNEGEGYQVISFKTDRISEGQTVVKFIREQDLREIDTLSFWKNK